MFKKIQHTAYHPKDSIFVWDGNCGFCRYWKVKWEHKLSGRLQFVTLQNTAADFKDIPKKEFLKASKLIEPNGRVYNGPYSIFRLFSYHGNSFWQKCYEKFGLFRWLSDHAYNHIAKNRSFYLRLSKLLFGK